MPSSNNKFRWVIGFLTLLIIVVIAEAAYFLFFRSPGSTTPNEQEREISLPGSTPLPSRSEVANSYLDRVNREITYMMSFYDTDTVNLLEDAKINLTAAGTVYSVEPINADYLIVLFDNSYKGSYIYMTEQDLRNMSLVGFDNLGELKQGDVLEVKVETDLISTESSRVVTITLRSKS